LLYVFLRKYITMLIIVFFVSGCSNYKVVSPKVKHVKRGPTVVEKTEKLNSWIRPVKHIKPIRPKYRSSKLGFEPKAITVKPSLGKSRQNLNTRTELPSLIVTNSPPPKVIYRRGYHDTVLATGNNMSPALIRIDPMKRQNIETPVTRKANQIQAELNEVDDNLTLYKRKFEDLKNKQEAEASDYYNLVAAISAALQTGTTNGNPILIDRWNAAQDKLNGLSQTNSLLNNLAVDLAYHASKAAFILDSVKAAFELSGAIDEDHEKLTNIEDGVNQNITGSNRLIMRVSAELTRLETLMRTERANMQTLSLGIAKGELYGENLSNNLFKKAINPVEKTYSRKNRKRSSSRNVRKRRVSSRKPLVIIRFDRPNINYDKPLYTAISQVLGRFPDAKFDLLAISPLDKNPAKAAIAKSEARRNGEAVLHSLTKMGLPAERIGINSKASKNVLNSEIHIYIR